MVAVFHLPIFIFFSKFWQCVEVSALLSAKSQTCLHWECWMDLFACCDCCWLVPATQTHTHSSLRNSLIVSSSWSP